MDNLGKIQNIMKIMKILTKIGLVATIVGCIICALSLGLLLVTQFTGIMETETALEMITSKGNPLPVAYCGVIVGLVQCFFAMLICRKFNIYYVMEEKDGNPFEEESAKYLFKAAIYELIMGFVAFIVSVVIIAVFEAKNQGYSFPFDTKFSFDAVSFLFICFISLVFQYGAEVKRNK